VIDFKNSAEVTLYRRVFRVKLSRYAKGLRWISRHYENADSEVARTTML
jgi:hypothetical protein